MKLHAGCGRRIEEGWVNIDIKRGDILADLSEGIPLPNNSCTHIFHEHFLEHLEYPSEATSFVEECYRVLKPQGIMRISVPDTEYTLRAYFEQNEEYFNRCRENWHPEWCSTMMESINYHFRQDGQHKFAYDYETLNKVLYAAGFSEIHKAYYDDSRNIGFDIDSRDDDGTLIVNCTKPLEERIR